MNRGILVITKYPHHMDTSATITRATDVITIPLRYCLYARKSSEEDERQAMSIDSQINEMLQMAEAQGLNITEIKREAHSAKASAQRPVFNELLQDIAQGKFNAVLTWAADRLSRNAGDLGSIVDLMDQGFLQEIKTHGQTFTNSPNEKFLLMILGSQAKLENDHRGVNVKRGLRAKAGTGWRPGMPPVGYNIIKAAGVLGNKIVVDSERAEVIKTMFKKVGIYGYSGRMIHKWLMTETTFTSRGGKALSLSNIYTLLKNPFYYGQFEYPAGSGNWYEGKHKPIIDKTLFEATQLQLKAPYEERAQWGSKEFHFTKLLTCGACKSGITAEEKFKPLKDGTRRRYVYYRCTKFNNKDCSEKYLREEEMVQQLLAIIDTIDLKAIATQRKFQQELERFRKFAKGILGHVSDSITANKQIDIRMYAKYVLQEGTHEEKKEILQCLNTKLAMKNQKIYIC
ncbi:MAG: recombinase family protein [Candidatus Kerfeldbacteria bacterium]|nr:recombinase family protein [Candidatus Kerfeldbacteria bacterium]